MPRSMISAITYQDFKNFFYRDGFSYIPQDEWSDSNNYIEGSSVYYRNTKKIYTALQDNINVIPSSDSLVWQEQPTNVFQYVLPEDVERAFTESQVQGNFSIITKEIDCTSAFYYLSAHLLYKRFSESDNKTPVLQIMSMSVDGVSETKAVPEWTKSQAYSMFTSSSFGYQYLAILYKYRAGAFIHITGRVSVI